MRNHGARDHLLHTYARLMPHREFILPGSVPRGLAAPPTKAQKALIRSWQERGSSRPANQRAAAISAHEMAQ